MRSDEMLILGVDPGSRSTGLVVRQGKALLAHQVVDSGSQSRQPDRRQLTYTLDVARQLLVAAAIPGTFGVFIVAIEDVNEPSPHLGVINLKGLLGTAKVLAAFESADWTGLVASTVPVRVLTVPPGRNGGNLLQAYPRELVSPAEARKGLLRPAGGSALIRHCRSAWDVAGAAPMRAALGR